MSWDVRPAIPHGDCFRVLVMPRAVTAAPFTLDPIALGVAVYGHGGHESHVWHSVFVGQAAERARQQRTASGFVVWCIHSFVAGGCASPLALDRQLNGHAGDGIKNPSCPSIRGSAGFPFCSANRQVISVPIRCVRRKLHASPFARSRQHVGVPVGVS
jgi:hypothetical protein